MVCCHLRILSTEPSALPSVVTTCVGHLMFGKSATMLEIGITFMNPTCVDDAVRPISVDHHSTPACGKRLPSRPDIVRRAHDSTPPGLENSSVHAGIFSAT